MANVDSKLNGLSKMQTLQPPMLTGAYASLISNELLIDDEAAGFAKNGLLNNVSNQTQFVNNSI